MDATLGTGTFKPEKFRYPEMTILVGLSKIFGIILAGPIIVIVSWAFGE